jgi:hypothetical protein
LSDELGAIGLAKHASRPIQDISGASSPVLWQQVMS